MPDLLNPDGSDQLALLKRHANQLAEHFDTVQIFTTRHSGPTDQTRAIGTGVGNWYARYGQVREWLTRSDAITKHEAVPKE